jgi:hypothetical protein
MPPGTRCWLVFTHFEPGRAEPTMAAYRSKLAERGQLLTSAADVSAWAFLYQLRPTSAEATGPTPK